MKVRFILKISILLIIFFTTFPANASTREGLISLNNKNESLYITPRDIFNLILKLNELGAKGYRLEATARGESFANFPENPYEIPVAAIVKLDKANTFQYFSAATYYPGEVLKSARSAGEKGFYFRDRLPFSGTDESDSEYEFDEKKSDRVFKDFEILYLNRKPDNGNIFIFERKNNSQIEVEFELITEIPLPGSSPRQSLGEKLTANLAKGFAPVSIFYIGPDFLRIAKVPGILFQKTKGENSDFSEKDYALAALYNHSKELNENAKAGFRLEDNDFLLSISSKFKDDAERYEYTILKTDKKSFSQDLLQISQSGGVFRHTSFYFYDENRLVFEKKLDGNSDKFEYAYVKVSNQPKELMNKKLKTLNKIIEENKRLEAEAENESKKLTEQGFAVREMFFSNDTFYVLYERLRN